MGDVGDVMPYVLSEEKFIDQEILSESAKFGGRIYTGSRVKHIKNTTDKNVILIFAFLQMEPRVEVWKFFVIL